MAKAALARRGSRQRSYPQQIWDYQTGDFSQWADQHYASASQLSIVTSPVRQGFTYAAKFSVASGQAASFDNPTIVNRGEVAASERQTGNPAEGDENWFGYSVYLVGNDFVDVGGSQWFAIWNFHHSGATGVPNGALLIAPNASQSLRLSVRGGTLTGDVPSYDQYWEIGALPKDQWVDVLIYWKSSSDPALGRCGIWINGEQRFAPTTPMPTMYPGQSNYLKQGIYRAAQTRTSVVYYTGTRRGKTAASVALGNGILSPFPKTATFTDDFTTADPAKWSGYGGDITVASGRLSCAAVTYQELVSDNIYDLTGSSVTVRLVQKPNTSNGSTECFLKVQTSPGNEVVFGVSGSLFCREVVAGVEDNTYPAAYDATAHAYLRISESAGTVTWATSPDKVTWTTQRTKVSTLPLSRCRVVFQAGNYNNATSPGVALFDDLNL